MRTRPLLLIAAALCTAPALWAQDADSTRSAPLDSSNVTVLDITIDPAANERYVVFLQKRIVYRAFFSEAGAALRMRSLGNKQLPFVVDISNGQDVSGGTELEIYPQADGDIELSVALAATVPVRFRLWSDARATARGQRSAEEGSWELGIDGLLGWHAAYETDSAAPFDASVTLGGCLTVRNGPGPLGFVNGCIFGMEWTRVNGDRSTVSLITEPHLRMSNNRWTDQGWHHEWGVLVRYAAYVGSEGDNFASGMLGVGGYIARDLRDLDGRGWRITLTARADKTKDRRFNGSGFATGAQTRWVPAFQLQIGRYR